MGAVLPARSETFVYREVFGLRETGDEVSVASLREPERGLGEARLEALADEAEVVYRPGSLRRGLVRGLTAPQVLLRGALDALTAPDVPLKKRPHVLAQCLGGLALAGDVGARGITHVHAHMAHAPAGVAMYAAQALGVPFSFTGHAADLFRDRSLLTTKLDRASFVACISEWHRGFYRQLVPLTEERLPVVRCGVDVGDEDVDEGAGLLAVGRLVRKKGFDVLLRALARLPEAPPLRLVGDGPEREALEALVHELGLEGRVELLGAQPNTEVQRLMRECAVFVLPCRVSSDGDRDGIPVVLMEAMAKARCVISGDIETIRELVEHDVTGLMVEPGDVDSLTEALGRVLEDPELRRRLARAGQEHVRREFSTNTNLARLRKGFARGVAVARKGLRWARAAR
ncbi:MAG: glycosyltransferase [Planctomycetota bacterium]